MPGHPPEGVAPLSDRRDPPRAQPGTLTVPPAQVTPEEPHPYGVAEVILWILWSGRRPMPWPLPGSAAWSQSGRTRVTASNASELRSHRSVSVGGLAWSRCGSVCRHPQRRPGDHRCSGAGGLRHCGGRWNQRSASNSADSAVVPWGMSSDRAVSSVRASRRWSASALSARVGCVSGLVMPAAV